MQWSKNRSMGIPFYQNHGGSLSIFQITPKLVAEWTWQPANTSSWQAAIIRKRPQGIQSLSGHPPFAVRPLP